MRAEGTDRGRNDDRKGGADTKRHPHLQWHAGEAETFVEHRDQNGAAADPEQASEKSRQRAHSDKQQCQFEESGEIQSVQHEPPCLRLERI
jgi:hypothetical protein